MNFGEYNQRGYPVQQRLNKAAKEDSYQFKTLNYTPTLNKCASQDRITTTNIESRITIQAGGVGSSRPDSQPGANLRNRDRNESSYHVVFENRNNQGINRVDVPLYREPVRTENDLRGNINQKCVKINDRFEQSSQIYFNQSHFGEQQKLASKSIEKNAQETINRKIISDLRKEKSNIIKELQQNQCDYHNLQHKFQCLQKENYELQYQFNCLTQTKNKLEDSKRSQREEMLESELTLSRRKSEKIQQSYEREIETLKRKISMLEQECLKNSQSNSGSTSFFSDTKFSHLPTASVFDQSKEHPKQEIQRLNSEIKKKNEMIKYLQIQCKKASIGGQGKDKLMAENAKISELYEFAKKQWNKYEKINEILRRENQQLETKLHENQKFLSSIVSRRQNQKNTQKEENNDLMKRVENEEKINRQLRNVIKDLEDDCQELRDKISSLNEKQQFIQKLKQKFIRLEEKGENYENMLAKSEKLRKQSLQALGNREQVIKALKTEEQKLNQKILKLEKQLKKKIDDVSKQKYDNLKIKIDLAQKQTEKQKNENKKLLSVKKKVQSLLEVSQQDYKILERQSEKEILQLKKEVRKFHEDQNNSEMKLKKMIEENDSLKEEYYLLEQKIINIEKSQIESIEKQSEEKVKKITEQKQQLWRKLEQKQNQFEVEMKKNEKAIIELKQRIENLEREKKNFEENTHQLEKQIKELKNLNHEKSTHSDQQNAKIKSQLEKLEEQMLQKSSQLKQLKEKVEIFEKQNEKLKSTNEKVKKNQSKLRESLEEMESSLKESEDKRLEVSACLTDKEEKCKDIEHELEELYRQFKMLKESFLELEQENQDLVSSMKVSKNLGQSILSLQQSEEGERPQFIQIDKNALLHICDLLSIEPVQGQLLKSIIQVIQSTKNEWSVVENYKQILDIFEVSREIEEGSHEMLIAQITSFRATISQIVEKLSLVEAKAEGLEKENHKMHKLVGKGETNKHIIAPLKIMVKDLNEEIIRMKLSNLSAKKELQLSTQFYSSTLDSSLTPEEPHN